MRVTGVRYTGKADVYNLEVPDTHDFAVQNGVIVHNCYDETRYFFMANPLPVDIPGRPAPKTFDPFAETKDNYDSRRRLRP